MRTTTIFSALTLSLGVSLLGQPADVMAAGCKKDTDCKGDRICENGTCVTPGAPSQPAESGCSTDQDCRADQYCETGVCITRPSEPPAAGTQPPPAATQPPPAGTQPPPGYGAPPPGYGQPAYPYGTPHYGTYAGGEVAPVVEYERRSTGLMVAGIVMTALGGLATIGGVIGTAVTSAEAGECTAYGCESGDPHPAPVVVLIGGAVVLITGIIFLAVGGGKVPVEQNQAVYVEPAPDGLRLRF
jgi:hypothetical protein